jgi:DNA-binding transcriptional MerR regulator
MSYTVGEVAKLSHVSVRTLHHYDAIGLLVPSGRTRASYRLYTEADLERLQQVLFFRALGFALEDVARVLDDPAYDRRQALVEQRALLADKRDELAAMLALVDKTLEAFDKGVTMNPQEMFEVFGDFDPKEHEAEAKERWGETPAYAESARRTKRYTKDDWKRIQSEGEAVADAFAQAMAEGAAPTSERAMDLAERARLHIDQWFYPCSREMHSRLGEMYVHDERFAAYYEKRRPGLTAYVRDAIVAHGRR